MSIGAGRTSITDRLWSPLPATPGARRRAPTTRQPGCDSELGQRPVPFPSITSETVVGLRSAVCGRMATSPVAAPRAPRPQSDPSPRP